MTKYPIGIQSFEKIISNGYLYVDKTRYIHDLICTGNYYFLSRPRRFGKSLMMSTIEAIFKGKKELFKGLAIERLEWNWDATHPVIHIDFNGENYKDENTLNIFIDNILSKFETEYGVEEKAGTFGLRFREIIRKASEFTGKGVVVLIDEYDKPILDALDDDKTKEANKFTLQAFYSVLKTMDPYIRFAMLTGISKFSKVSIFSGLNNLNDISLNASYNAICGISETELTQYFTESIKTLGAHLGMTDEEVHTELKRNYDGYHFAKKGEDIYNPFSLLNCFANEEFSDYWFATGTPTSLIRLIDKSNFPLPELDRYQCSEDLLTGSDIYLSDPVPLLFQSGYLTIKDYDSRFKLFTLGFPNNEVSEGFSLLLLKSFTRGLKKSSFIKQFVEDVENGNAEAFMLKLQSFLAGIPYDHARSSKTDKDANPLRENLEIHYQNIMYVIIKLMGFYTHTEYRTSDGRIDMIIETSRYIYVMEFKINSSAETALKQIDHKNYSLQFQYTGKQIIKIGASFSTSTRTLSDFTIA